MDPYSAEGELVNISNNFFQGQWQEVVDFDTSAFSADNALPARVLVLRARLALGQAEDVLAEVKGAEEPDLKAIAALAEFQLGKDSTAVIGTLPSDNLTVQIVGGTLLQAAGKSEEAIALLTQHQGSRMFSLQCAQHFADLFIFLVEAVAIIVQIHLQQNRIDLAVKEVTAARKWAQDSLLVNFAESWVGLRQGGDKYQQAFYVFEELAQAPSTSSVWSLVSQAVCELHLGRLEEAQAALDQIKDPNAEAIANKLVLATVAGNDASGLTEYVHAQPRPEKIC